MRAKLFLLCITSPIEGCCPPGSRDLGSSAAVGPPADCSKTLVLFISCTIVIFMVKLNHSAERH